MYNILAVINIVKAPFTARYKGAHTTSSSVFPSVGSAGYMAMSMPEAMILRSFLVSIKTKTNHTPPTPVNAMPISHISHLRLLYRM
jgi:hypothetical protein